MSEEEIQFALYHRLATTRDIMVPNCYALGWECDLLRITPALYTHGDEIKTTVSDFKAEFKKRGRDTRRKPNYYWFVMPRELVPIENIPIDAGLLWISHKENHVPGVHVARAAPRLHKERAEESLVMTALSSAYFRYWQNRWDLLCSRKEAALYRRA